MIGLLFYTQTIVQQLQEKEHRYADLYVKSLEYIGSELASENSDLTLITEEIINKIDFPVIIADPNHVPSGSKNIEYDSSMTHEQYIEFLTRERDRMKERNPPIALVYQDTIVTQYIYYEESDLVRALQALPYVEIIVGSLFVLIGYIGFSYIKRNEQANIWVGLSKETAHQLGTPLSSMLGWLELLKGFDDAPEEMKSIIREMGNDVERLNRIALRFSKIGSKPELTEQNLVNTIYKSVEYFRKRIPQMGKRISIQVDGPTTIMIRFNTELFEWVLENLLKNALDAIEGDEGSITLKATITSRSALVDVTDSGKGLDMRLKKDIFRPGYSTKKRGWGLGLSLARRIVEQYHGGKLYVLNSEEGKGTTFRIKLPL